MKPRTSSLLHECVDKVCPNSLGVGIALQLPTLEDPFYLIASPGGFTPTEAALIEAEGKRRGCEVDIQVKCDRLVRCGLCGVPLASSYIDCEDPARLRIQHVCEGGGGGLGSVEYTLTAKPRQWEAPVFAYPSRLAWVKDTGPENERGVVVGLPLANN